MFALARSGNVSAFLPHFAEHYADVEEHTGNTLLHVVTTGVEADALIAAGADVNAVNRYGQTPLHTAQYVDCVKSLLRAGAKVNVYDAMGQTPLHNALNPMLCNQLLEAGANVHARDMLMKTPLHCVSNCVSLKLMLIHEADPNAVDGLGQTPLHCRDYDETRVLVKYGAFVDAKDFLRLTPYADAVRNNSLDVAGFLFMEGCNVTGGLKSHLFLHFIILLTS